MVNQPAMNAATVNIPIMKRFRITDSAGRKWAVRDLVVADRQR
jgi:hypothetical protein